MANRFKAINVSLGSTKNKPVDAEVTSMQGRKGDTGPYFTPSVDTNGNISWTNNGGLINPETRNIKGPKGDSGVYYGDTEPTDPNVDVWIDPEGTPTGLTAEDIGYDDQETYSNGTVGGKIQELDIGLAQKAGILRDTATGSVASFVPDATIPDLLGLSVAVEPVQSGSGDPSPTNVRPITGYTGATAYVSPTQDAQDGTTIPVTWQSEVGTVYGGTFDFVSGMLTVDRASFVVSQLTQGSMTTGTAGVGCRFSGLPAPAKMVSSGSSMIVANPLCSALSAVGAAYYERAARWEGSVSLAGKNGYSIWDSGKSLFIYLLGTEWTAETFAAAVADWHFVYELAAPVEYQLTPAQIHTLLGTNNVWSDAGDVTVDFAADLKTYIDNKISVLAAQIVNS